MEIALIGHGAIATYVAQQLDSVEGAALTHVIVRPGRQAAAIQALGAPTTCVTVTSVDQLSSSVQLVVDCAGHAGLAAHGIEALQAGFDVLTVSIGALADAALAKRLHQAELQGHCELHLATGAIGALDALSAAAVGGLDSVVYRGRKPPQGWRGSPAEEVLDLDKLQAADGEAHPGHGEAQCHFRGNAGEAARRYPKNANVAAAVALAGIGFEETIVELWADPGIGKNIHEVEAQGTFGRFRFEIEGDPLPDNPKSSALAAMSVVAHIERLAKTNLKRSE
ncbi:MAG: aspartate dehydrogenase [Acidimicrobiales bacterium]